MMTTLTTVGLGLATSSPAAATTDTHDIDAVQARVVRLSHQADAAAVRHDRAETTLTRARTSLDRLSKGIQHQRWLMDSLRSQVASTVVGQYDDQYDGHYSVSVGLAAPAPSLSEGSEVLLTNATSVSEDIGRRGDALAESSTRLQQLGRRRVAVRDQVTMLSRLERRLQAKQGKVDSRAASASATLDSLQKKAAAERMAELGGPVLAYAKAQVGKSYVFGAAGPDSFDCSGLTMMAWSQSGVSLPHNSTAQYNSGPHISESELKPGDLVFYYSPISHVGIYIGNGKVVNALNPGSGVRISGLHDMPYVGAVRPG